jgi:hypothetical protein
MNDAPQHGRVVKIHADDVRDHEIERQLRDGMANAHRTVNEIVFETLHSQPRWDLYGTARKATSAD